MSLKTLLIALVAFFIAFSISCFLCKARQAVKKGFLTGTLLSLFFAGLLALLLWLFLDFSLIGNGIAIKLNDSAVVQQKWSILKNILIATRDMVAGHFNK